MIVNGWNLEMNNELWKQIEEEYNCKNISPKREDMLKAFELTSLDNVKVVIFGQDPYPKEGVATGLAFSANGNVPASLRNMYKELEDDLGIVRTDPNLEDWAMKGILLLNTSLIVEVGNANSHKDLPWNELIEVVINQIDSTHSDVVYVLLGNNAKKLKQLISEKQTILEFVHPSPLSARRGYFGCKMFSKINASLKDNGKEQIDFHQANEQLSFDI